MKKRFCLIGILIIVLGLCGCSNSYLHNTINSNNEILTEKTTDDVVLPNAELLDINSEECMTELFNPDFHILDILGDNYYGYKTTQNNDQTENEYLLADSNSNIQKSLNYQTGTKEWVVGSGSAIVMGNRYCYEWLSYTPEMSDDQLQDVRLIRTDGQTGNVEVIDEVKQSSPFIYLYKIDKEHFLSFSLTQASSKKTDYAVISSASIYSITGEKKKIINERYENNENWSNSEGVLIEQFAINNGEIYGYGRKQINKEYKHFLYHYDVNGKLINEELLDGFENIIGSEQPIEFIYSGDYIAFKTFESMSNYICKKSDKGIELIMKGIDEQVQYTAFDKYIFFIESNVDVYTAKTKEIDCPLYIIDTSTDSVKAINFEVPIEKPYFYSISVISNNSVILSYCDKDYNPLEIHQFLIESKTVESIFQG